MRNERESQMVSVEMKLSAEQSWVKIPFALEWPWFTITQIGQHYPHMFFLFGLKMFLAAARAIKKAWQF